GGGGGGGGRGLGLAAAGGGAWERACDDRAPGALGSLAGGGGRGGVAESARRQVAELERRYRPVMESAGADKVKALAEALSADGYAASATSAPSLAAGGGEQLCQHHCPVAHVAAEFPQLCEAETEAFARLLVTPV